MGVVYLGVAPNYLDSDGSQVAVKVLRSELADDPEFRARFGREVASLMRVRGECTVRVIEADTESSQPLYRILHGSPDIAAVPPALQMLVMSALAKDPERRPTAHELLDLLTDPAVGEDRPAQAVLFTLAAHSAPRPPARAQRPVLGAPIAKCSGPTH